VLAVRVQPTGMPEPMWIVNTHVQAQAEEGAIRLEPIDPIARFVVDKKITGSATIFTGDFNFKPEKGTAFSTFVTKAPYVDAGKRCMDDPAACKVALVPGVTEIDDVYRSAVEHQFMRSAAGARYVIRPTFVTRSFPEDFKGGHLSDHSGYEVHYAIHW
jgi:hypothetical protein